MNKKDTIIAIIVLLLFFGLLGSCSSEETEYERAGKEFGSWINDDPRTWSDTEKEYFDNFMDWADKN